MIGANQGTRYIEITLGGWDMHQNIYSANQLPQLAGQLDNGLSALIGDLQASGDFADTLIVMAGEFGRTVGPLTGAKGRDHLPQQFVFFSARREGRQSDRDDGCDRRCLSTDPGWSRDRIIKPEDIEATIYSAMGLTGRPFVTTIRWPRFLLRAEFGSGHLRAD